MRVLLVNPANGLVNILRLKESRWNRYRVWQPLSLMTLAGVTPPDWDVEIVDENLGVPNYATMERPDLVGITAFTSQASRAYAVAAHFRRVGVPVVMGGIHATMCLEEALGHVDAVVTGEADGIWPQVLEHAHQGRLQRRYDGGFASIQQIGRARHDLLPGRYAFGAIQTTRGCPLNCFFCSVSAFNGSSYRQRPIEDVVGELQSIPERRVLVVDDNLIGTRTDHIERAKSLFRAMIRAKVNKDWIAQTTINFADDEELLVLAAEAGCKGVFIGFESPTAEGLREVGKNLDRSKSRDIRASVGRIHHHGMMVVGSFIIGLDADGPGIGTRVADAASHYGIDGLNALFLTPLPGTRLWKKMSAENRIAVDDFPEDWQYFTLTFPVARYKHLSLTGVMDEMNRCGRIFYSIPRILRRLLAGLWQRRGFLINLVTSLSYRANIRMERKAFAAFERRGADGADSNLERPRAQSAAPELFH
jgi:radical SAM superfamily enzyme YgiQ (UPF0313 family)